jgi:cell division protein ZipA
MTASLILALITIAGLGILALVLIFFGGSKKHQAKYAKDKQVKKKEEENPANKAATTNSSHSSKEPYISVDLASTTEEIIVKPKAKSHEKIDPALTSLGFSALDDLLPEPEVKTTSAITETTNDKITPIEFNSAPKKKTSTRDIIVLYVMAPVNQPFVGYELLQAVTAAGLRFGKMDIFHYQDDEKPENVLFSLCSAVEPGSFDIANMGALICPGLSLFMRISAVENSKTVFNLMLETAGQLADDLAGYVCDEKRQPLTDEKLHEYLRLAAKQNEFA